MNDYTWSNNKEDELWEHGLFESKEKCIIDAKTNYDKISGETIAIGIVLPFKLDIDAETVLEQIEEDAFEHCGEASENWLSYEASEIQELSKSLNTCVNEWLIKTKQTPTFYGIGDIETVTID